jgi:hypothetical protein
MSVKMSGPEALSKGLKKVGGLSFIAVSLLHILSIPLSLASAAVLLPSSTLAGIQALQGVSITYGTWVGTVIALELFAVLGFGALYFVLRGINQLGAVAGVLLIMFSIGVGLAADFPLRYAQINLAAEYAAATSDLQRSGIAAAYQLALDTSNIAALMENVIAGLGFLVVGYAMLKDKFMFGRPISYLALLGGVLFIASLPASASPAAFAGIFLVSSLVLAAFGALVGRKLYRM